MTQLQADLLIADPRLVAGRLELASRWLHSDLAVRAALGQAVVASEKEKQGAANASDDREAALKDAKAALTIAKCWRASCRACATGTPKRCAAAKRRRRR